MRKYLKMTLLAAMLCLLAGCGQSGKTSQEETAPVQSEQNEQELPEETVSPDQPAEETPKEEPSEQTYTDNFDVDGEAAAAFAKEIQSVVADRDLEGLADLMMFPNYVGFQDEGQFVESREEFLDLGAERIFTEELLSEIATADTENLEPSQAGFALSTSGRPNIVFGVYEGHLAIVGINY